MTDRPLLTDLAEALDQERLLQVSGTTPRAEAIRTGLRLMSSSLRKVYADGSYLRRVSTEIRVLIELSARTVYPPDADVYLNSPLPGCGPAMPATSARALAYATSPEEGPATPTREFGLPDLAEAIEMTTMHLASARLRRQLHDLATSLRRAQYEPAECQAAARAITASFGSIDAAYWQRVFRERDGREQR